MRKSMDNDAFFFFGLVEEKKKTEKETEKMLTFRNKNLKTLFSFIFY